MQGLKAGRTWKLRKGIRGWGEGRAKSRLLGLLTCPVVRRPSAGIWTPSLPGAAEGKGLALAEVSMGLPVICQGFWGRRQGYSGCGCRALSTTPKRDKGGKWLARGKHSTPTPPVHHQPVSGSWTINAED